MVARTWTDEQDSDLLNRWNVLKQSTRQIGDAFGLTKSAVCGRLQRLRKQGADVDVHFERNYVLRRPKKEADDEAPKVEVEPEDEVTPPPALRFPYAESVAALTAQVMEMGPRACRFIEGDPLKGGSFCAEPAKPESSYCPKHHKLCWRKAEGMPIDLETFREARVIVRAP